MERKTEGEWREHKREGRGERQKEERAEGDGGGGQAKTNRRTI